MGKERGGGRNYGFGIQQLTRTSAEPKFRPHLRHLVRRVQGQGNGAERAEEGVNTPLRSGTFLLVLPTQFLLFLESGLCICD